MSYVSAQKRELELTPIPANFMKGGGFIGRIRGRRTLSYGEVLDEIVGNRILNLDRSTLHLILTHTFETMIRNTLKDGNSRKLSDYFTLQVEVRGRFDEPGDQFDSREQSFRLVLRPLSGIRDRKPDFHDGLTVYNRNAGPAVKIDRMYSVSAPEGKGLVFGDDLILEGENLFLDETKSDEGLRFKYFAQRGSSTTAWDYYIPRGAEVSEDGRQIRIPWATTIGAFIKNNFKEYDPAISPPVALMAAVRSRGGAPTSKRQKHRARAYFDTWLAKYPNSSYKSTIWGRI